MTVIVNPGSGPVEGEAQQARANLDVLLADASVGHDGPSRVLFLDALGRQQDGRFRFVVRSGEEAEVEIDMPGLALERVRYMQERDQNIFDFPRLYVNGSSWLWCFAVTMVGEALRGR